MSYVTNLLSSFLPSLIIAIILLVVAFIVAGIARKLIKKFHLENQFKKLNMDETSAISLNDFVGNLVYFIVFLLFVPAIFENLGITSISAPINNMVTTFLGFIPNLVACAIILIVGYYVAKFVRDILKPIFKALKVDNIQTKMNVEVTEKNSLSNVLATVVFYLILIPLVISALNVLEISAISDPATAMLSSIFNYIPIIFVAIIIIIFGVIIGNFVEGLLASILASVGIDSYLSKVVNSESNTFKNVVLSKLIATIVKVIIIIIFVVEALNVINLDILSEVGTSIISYLPSLLSAIIIMLLAYLFGNFLEKSINKRTVDNSKFLGMIVKIIIIVFAIFMVLSELSIASDIVNIAFIIILTALGVAFALAFGLGGRDYAKKKLEDLDKKI